MELTHIYYKKTQQNNKPSHSKTPHHTTCNSQPHGLAEITVLMLIFAKSSCLTEGYTNHHYLSADTEELLLCVLFLYLNRLTGLKIDNLYFLIDRQNMAYKYEFHQKSKKCSLPCPEKLLINANCCVPSQHVSLTLVKKNPNKQKFISAKYFQSSSRLD